MASPNDFTLPELGEGVMEAEVVKWLVSPGQAVQIDQPLVQVMTDKATVEIPAPRAATIGRLLAQEGDMVKVGSPLLEFAGPGNTVSETMPQSPGSPPPAPKPPQGRPPAAAPPAPAPLPAKPTAAMQPAPRPLKAEPPAPEPVSPGAAAPLLATPSTRALARERGVDLRQVRGTGPAGRITREDVEAFIAGRQAQAANQLGQAGSKITAAEAPAVPHEERIRVIGLRRKIAERMVTSAFTAPHVTHVDEVDITALAQLRQDLLPAAEGQGVKLSYLPFFAKILAIALREFPYLNSSFDSQSGELVLKRYYHIGIATATDQGLLVPVVRDVAAKSILELAREMADVTQRTRQGKATLEELTGSTFTITNYGSVGGLFGTPIINHPEVAILGLGKSQRRPVVRDDQVVVREMMYLALTFDHRVIDGADAARFVNRLKFYLESPGRLLLDLA